MNLKIKETDQNDLENIINLWANGKVMKFVGFPNGLYYTDKEIKNWYLRIKDNRPYTNHYSLFIDESYCGEAFYSINNAYKTAAMDIKILPMYHGRGIAYNSLIFAINKAFENGANKCWVDPNPSNKRAVNLYERIGFKKKDLPIWVKEYPDQVYYEIDKKDWNYLNERNNN